MPGPIQLYLSGGDTAGPPAAQCSTDAAKERPIPLTDPGTANTFNQSTGETDGERYRIAEPWQSPELNRCTYAMGRATQVRLLTADDSISALRALTASSHLPNQSFFEVSSDNIICSKVPHHCPVTVQTAAMLQGTHLREK